MDISELLSGLKTTEDRSKILSEIELLSESLYREGEFREALGGRVSETLGDYFGYETSREVLDQKMSQLKKSLDELRVLKLIIAFEPSQATIDKIISFVRQALDKKTIVQISTEPHILGGLIFEYGGLYKDYTLKTKLEEVFKNKREELFSIVNSK